MSGAGRKGAAAAAKAVTKQGAGAPEANGRKEPRDAGDAAVYFCQKCRKVIQLSSRATFSEGVLQDVQKSFDWTLVSPHLQLTKSGEDFSLTMAQLLDFTAEVTEEDQPLCFDCTRGVIDALEGKLALAEREREEYSNFLLSLQQQLSENGEAYDEALTKEEQMLAEEERRLQAEMERVQQQREELRKETALVAEEKLDVERQTEAYWRGCNRYITEDTQLNERKAALEHRLQAERDELDKLHRTNVLNEAFQIWHDGNFGTINNFRLGKLPSITVEWNEINAAWGHAALLLSTIQHQRDIPATQFRVKPMGSFSVVEKLESGRSPQSLELFGGSQVFWASTRFDRAMVGFLFCLDEAIRHEIGRDSSLKIPFPINGDRIGNLSVKLSGNQEEKWTRALKYLLIDLKWLVAVIAAKQADATRAELDRLQQQHASPGPDGAPPVPGIALAAPSP